MNIIYQYFINEYFKTYKNKQILYIYLFSFALITIVAYNISNGKNSDDKYDSHLSYVLSHIYVFFQTSYTFCIPVMSLVFFVILDLERKDNATEWMYTLPIYHSYLIFVKFLFGYFMYILFVLLAFGINYIIMLYGFQNKGVLSPIEFSIVSKFYIREVFHLCILTLPYFYTFYITSLVVKKTFLSLLILLNIHILSFQTYTLLKPYNGFLYANSLEIILQKGSVLFNSEDIYNVYYYCIIYLILLFIISFYNRNYLAKRF